MHSPTAMGGAIRRYRVLSPIIFPVAARTDDVIMVRPGHPEYPVMVIRHDGTTWRFVRTGPPNYGALLGLDVDGIIRNLEIL